GKGDPMAGTEKKPGDTGKRDQDNKPGTDSKEASPGASKALDELLKQLESKDAKTREDAVRRLEDLIKKADDPQVRKAMEEAAKQAENLKKATDNGDQKARDEATHKLKDLEKQASDPRLKKGFEDALKKYEQGKQNSSDPSRTDENASQQGTEGTGKNNARTNTDGPTTKAKTGVPDAGKAGNSPGMG